MTEKLDLNALRSVVEKQRSADGKAELELGSRHPLADKIAQVVDRGRQLQDEKLPRAEKIALLEAEIARLQAEQRAPTPLEVFDAMSPEEQMWELARVIPEIPEVERDPKIWRQELVRASKNSPIPLRILVAEAKLKELRGE